MDRSTASGSLWVTAAVGGAAALVAVGTLLLKWLAPGERQPTELTEAEARMVRQHSHDSTSGGSSGLPSARSGGAGLPPLAALDSKHKFHRALAMSNTVPVGASGYEWSDRQLGVVVAFSQQSLQLVHEERHAPVVLLKFVCFRETENTVQCILEELPEDLNAERYCEFSVKKIEGVARIHHKGTVRIGTDVFPQVVYSYLAEMTEAVLHVVSVFLCKGCVGITMQYCSPCEIPKTMPAAFHELVRKTRFVAPRESPSYLFFSEPRLGVGFRLPLGFTLQPLMHHSGHDITSLPPLTDEYPLALLTSSTSHISLIAQYIQQHSSPASLSASSSTPTTSLASIRHVLERVLRTCYEQFAFRGTPSFVFQSPASTDSLGMLVMRPCVIHAPTNRDGEFGYLPSTSHTETVTREITGFFCFHEMLVDLAEDGEVMGGLPFVTTTATSSKSNAASLGRSSTPTSIAHAYFGMYCLAIRPGEYVYLAFRTPRTGSLERFVHICKSIADSFCLGNHYGQEASLTYCNLRHRCMFHIDVSNSLRVMEPRLGDPVCVLRSQGGVATTTVICRILPCPVDPATGADDPVALESEALAWVRLLGHRAIVLSRTSKPLQTIGGHVVQVVHQHDFSALDAEDDSDEFLDDAMLRNPLAMYEDDECLDLQEPVSVWTSALVSHSGRAYLFQTVSNSYCALEGRRVVEEVISGFSPFSA